MMKNFMYGQEGKQDVLEGVATFGLASRSQGDSSGRQPDPIGTGAELPPAPPSSSSRLAPGNQDGDDRVGKTRGLEKLR